MMLFHYQFMLPALAICLILAGIHTYFGYHIVQRGVIFVDLSLSQIAALGASVAILMGWGENAPLQNFCVSLVFTMAGAVLSRGVLLSHYGRRNGAALLESAAGVLMPGGFLLCDFLSKTGRLLHAHRPENKTHFTPDEACAMARRAGFRNATVRGGGRRRVLLLFAERD